MTGLCLLLTLFIARAACAQTDQLRYKVGRTVFSENAQALVIGSAPPTAVEIAPGGKLWPPVSIDESGRIYVGNAVIDANSGQKIIGPKPARGELIVRYPHAVQVAVSDAGYEFERNGLRCRFAPKRLGLGAAKSALAWLKDGNLRLATSNGAIRALVTQFSSEGRVSGYQVDNIDLASCKVASVTKLGDPDLLVEFASSPRGGWWITGSIEQTLLRSLDGRKWQKVALPRDLSSLISSYAVSPREIWLAAILAGTSAPSPYLLGYSADAGKTWTSLKKDDPLLAKVPAAWLEGQRRIAVGEN